jgi:hypothetical protein
MARASGSVTSVTKVDADFAFRLASKRAGKSRRMSCRIEFWPHVFKVVKRGGRPSDVQRTHRYLATRSSMGGCPVGPARVIDKDELKKMTEGPFPARTVPTGWPARFRPESAADKKICKVSP